MIQLSPSKLNILKDCPRCFWDTVVKNQPRPRGIFPSLPGGMDQAFKVYFDQYRGSLPPGLENKIKGVLMPDQGKINRWRNWRTGLEYQDSALGVRVIGALDDCVVDGRLLELHIPLDYKTKGWKPKTDGREYYQLQLDVYEHMLQANGYKTAGISYLVYYWPSGTNRQAILSPPIGQNYVLVNFDFEVFKIPTSSERAVEFIRRALYVVKHPRPAPAGDCEHCKFAINYSKL